MLVLPAVAVLLPPRLDGVVVRRGVADRVTCGKDVDVVLTVRNEGRRTTSLLTLDDRSEGLSTVAVSVPPLRPGEAATVRLRRTARRRGRFDAGTAELTSTAPLGLLRARRTVPVPGRLIVHPALVGTPPLRAGATDGAGELPIPEPGVGTEVLGLRDWRSGDSARAVSARASARHGRPLVLERERDTGSSLVLLAGGPGRGPEWESAVSRGAALALAALATGTPPVLLGAPAPARLDRIGVLDWFAGVDCATGVDPDAVASALRLAAGGALALLVPAGLPVERARLQRACDATRTRLVLLDA